MSTADFEGHVVWDTIRYLENSELRIMDLQYNSPNRLKLKTKAGIMRCVSTLLAVFERILDVKKRHTNVTSRTVKTTAM